MLTKLKKVKYTTDIVTGLFPQYRYSKIFLDLYKKSILTEKTLIEGFIIIESITKLICILNIINRGD